MERWSIWATRNWLRVVRLPRIHNILPPDNPKSLISESRLVETCGKCHEGANTNFVQFVTHATHTDPEREPVLYGTFVLMTGLLVSVFGIFWFHSFLWWRKDFWEKRGVEG